MDGDSSVLLFDEDEKDDSDLDDLVKRNLLPELDSPLKLAKEYVKVYLRIRPLTKEEHERHENKGCVEVEDSRSVVVHAPKDSNTHRSTTYGLAKQAQKFTFSKVFGENTSQKTFFDETMLSTVKQFINGENCLVFSYGVTNSGKTYTIQGDPKDGGLLPRSLDVVFNSIANRLYGRMDLKPNMYCDVARLTREQEQAEIALKESIMKMTFVDGKDDFTLGNSSDSSQHLSEDSVNQLNADDSDNITEEISTVVANRKREEATIDVKSQGHIRFSVWVSFVEIYNEQMFDLLVPVPKKKTDRRPILQLREDKYGNPYVKDLRQINVTSADEAYRLLALGKRNLKIACTKLNQSSSRSHCIFTIKMIRVVDKDKPHYARISMLSLCDLAGSERQQKTDSVGDRLKEAGNINSSLLTLGRCITALRNNQGSRPADRLQIVPFRDSRLTRLFQSYLTGKGRASMVVNINQRASMFDETLNSLRYSAIAKQVVVRESMPKPLEPVVKRQDSLLPSKTTISRETIGWATPGTYQKMIEAGELSVSGLTFPPTKEEPNETDDMDETVNEDDEEEGNCTMTEYETSDDAAGVRAQWTKERTMLLDIIKQLKEKLQTEMTAKDSLEVKIRAEVCEEMKKQLVIIENQYQENLRVREEINEEKLEKKMEILMEAMQKSKKRRLESDDEECVPKHLLDAETAKVQKLQNRVDELKEELKAATEELSHVKLSFTKISKERESLAQETTKAQFFASDAKQRLDDMKSKLNESCCLTVDLNEQIRSLSEECESQRLAFDKSSEIINDLESKNKSLLETLETRDRQMEEIKAGRNRVLSDDGEKERVPGQQQQQVCLRSDVELLKEEVRKIAEERDRAVDRSAELDNQVLENEQQIADLQAQNAEIRKDLTSSKNELLLVTHKLNLAKAERDKLAKLNEDSKESTSCLQKQLSECQAELSAAQNLLSVAQADLTAFQRNHDSSKKETDDDISVLRSQLLMVRTELAEYKSKVCDLEKLKAVACERDELLVEKQKLVDAASRSDADVANLGEELSVCHRNLEAAEAELDGWTRDKQSLVQERDDLMEQLHKQNALTEDLQEKLKSFECQNFELEEKCVSLSLELEQLNARHVGANDELRRNSAELADLSSEKQRIEDECEKLKLELDRRVRAVRDELEERLDSTKSLVNNDKEKLEQMQQRLDEKSELISHLHGKLGVLNDDYEMKKLSADKLAEDVARLETEVSGLVEQLTRLTKTETNEAAQKENRLLEQKLTASQVHVRELEEKLLSAQQQFLTSEAAVNDLKSQLEKKNDTITKLSRLSLTKKSNSVGGPTHGPGFFSSNDADDESDISRMEFENLINRTMPENKQTSASKGRARSTYGKPKHLKQVENLDPVDEVDQMDDDFGRTPRRSSRKTPSTSRTQSASDAFDSVFKSPPKSPSVQKRRRKLLSTVDEQLVATPAAEDEQDEFVAPSPHTSVIRKLRSRRQ